MRPRPDAAALLDIAHRTQRGGVLAALPEAARYQALMVAHAMAIAARIAERGEAPERDELARLAKLMIAPPIPPTPDMAAVREELKSLYGRLGDELRAGKIAPGTDRHRAVFAHLRLAIVERLRESNPKALPA